MAIGCLPPPLALFALGASSLPDAPSPVATYFFVIFIGLLFFYYFCLFGTLCGCCSWGMHSNSPPPDCFVCAVDLLCVHFATHRLLPGLFSHPHRDELPTLPSVLVSSLHVIGSLPVAVIHIVIFFPLVLLVYFLVFMFFPCFFFFFAPLFPFTFSFLFLLVIMLYPFSLIYPVLHWSKPYVVDVNDFLAFGLRMMSFGMRILLSGPMNERYLCVGWCLFGIDLILNLMYSHGLADAFGYG
jgi:hypothetical protein